MFVAAVSSVPSVEHKRLKYEMVRWLTEDASTLSNVRIYYFSLFLSVFTGYFAVLDSWLDDTSNWTTFCFLSFYRLNNQICCCQINNLLHLNSMLFNIAANCLMCKDTAD